MTAATVAPKAPPAQNYAGLSAAELLQRRAARLGNSAPPATTRSYRRILRQNVFTFISTVLYATSIGLIAMGRWGDALVTAGLVLLNVAIAVLPEARAKHTLDRITLLTRPRVNALRDALVDHQPAGDPVLGHDCNGFATRGRRTGMRL